MAIWWGLVISSTPPPAASAMPSRRMKLLYGIFCFGSSKVKFASFGHTGTHLSHEMQSKRSRVESIRFGTVEFFALV